MLKDRPIHLLFLSASLLWSPATFSVSDTVAAPIQVSMLIEKQGSSLEKVLPANSTSHASPAVEIVPRYTDEEIAELRQIFLQAEEALKKRHDADYFLLSDQLKEYPLYPYLQYQWLKNNLGRERQVKYFLQTYQSSRYARLLKHRWLTHLARNNQWQTFLEFYTNTSDANLNCYHHWAQYKTGDKQTALNGAAELWAVGKSQPKTCDPLFAQLKKSSQFNQALFWQRFDAAMQSNNIGLAKYVKQLMTPANQKTAGLWLKLYRDPERYLATLLSFNKTAQMPLMLTYAIHRLSRTDINQAVALWDKNKSNFTVDKERVEKLEKRLASKLAYDNEAGAYERLGQLNDADTHSKTLRIRLALQQQNWPRVINAIADLNSEDQAQEKWQYWLARAYQETGKSIQADEILSKLAKERDFYGYLAADRLDRLYQLVDKPIEVTPQEIAAIRNHKEFRAAFEFMALDRERVAKQQWWHALRQLDKSEYPAAAKLAQQWQWDEIAIFTIAKVKQWDDIDLRFPLSYADKIHQNAAEQNLNPVILFGLVRRESAFNKDAYSPVGARGLMQIMPQTARQIAKDLNERWTGKKDLFNPVKNLKYGSYYYQKLLNQFDGHYALALAAYNAGPSRVKQWLPDESIPADIWIETIPYRETRNYVTSVLVYAMIYQQRINSTELTMHDLTREVQPL